VATTFRAGPRQRCSTGFRSGLSHCGASPQRIRGLSRARLCVCSREPASRRAQGKASRDLSGSLIWAPSSSPCPPCWSRRSVAQYLCGHRARRIMRTEHAVSQGSNWTRSERARRCKHRRDPHRSHPPVPRRRPWRQPDGAAERSRTANLCSVHRSAGRPQPLWAGREHPARLRQGTRVSRPAPAGVRDAHPRRPPPRSLHTTRRC
jgi:hypothetical protein